MALPLWWGWWTRENTGSAISDMNAVMLSIPNSVFKLNIPSMALSAKRKAVRLKTEGTTPFAIFTLNASRSDVVLPPPSNLYELTKYNKKVKGGQTETTVEEWTQVGPPIGVKDAFRGKLSKIPFFPGKEDTEMVFYGIHALKVKTGEIADPLSTGFVQPGETEFLMTKATVNGPLITKLTLLPKGVNWFQDVIQGMKVDYPEIETELDPAELGLLMGLPFEKKTPLLFKKGYDYVVWKLAIRRSPVLPKTNGVPHYNVVWEPNSSDAGKAARGKFTQMLKVTDFINQIRVRPKNWEMSLSIGLESSSINGSPLTLVTATPTFTFDGQFLTEPDTYNGTYRINRKRLTTNTEQTILTVTTNVRKGKENLKETARKIKIKSPLPWYYVARSQTANSCGGDPLVSTAVAVFVSPVELTPLLTNFSGDTLGDVNRGNSYRCGISSCHPYQMPWCSVEYIKLEEQRWNDWMLDQMENGFPDYMNGGKTARPGVCRNFDIGEFVDRESIAAMARKWKLGYTIGTYHVYILRHQWDTWAEKLLLDVLRDA